VYDRGQFRQRALEDEKQPRAPVPVRLGAAVTGILSPGYSEKRRGHPTQPISPAQGNTGQDQRLPSQLETVPVALNLMALQLSPGPKP
jgi:hypothetical protein